MGRQGFHRGAVLMNNWAGIWDLSCNPSTTARPQPLDLESSDQGLGEPTFSDGKEPRAPPQACPLALGSQLLTWAHHR